MGIIHDVIACNITEMEYRLLWYGFLATPSTPRCPLVLLVQPSFLFYIYSMGFPLVPRIWYGYYAVRCFRYSYDGVYGYFDKIFDPSGYRKILLVRWYAVSRPVIDCSGVAPSKTLVNKSALSRMAVRPRHITVLGSMFEESIERLL